MQSVTSPCLHNFSKRGEKKISFLMLLIRFIPRLELLAALLLTELFFFYVMTESNNALIFNLNELCCKSHIDLLTVFIEKNYIHSLEKSIYMYNSDKYHGSIASISRHDISPRYEKNDFSNLMKIVISMSVLNNYS